MNVEYSIIIRQKAEFLGLLFIQNTHHQMIVTATPLARILLVVTNVSVMKDGVRSVAPCALLRHLCAITYT